ncbi:hypothetical protein FH972_025061 [Carpinus fangiana]|uniref:BHLH domain-containing protein n=1 Tax=Carpinus fangiana TaxID=176857 RepID=A0A5N6L0A6_9ROSI|nr:hypothetical protein FH972_025061 [Carpinus fangiana]
MPKTTFPPTPAPSTDIKGQVHHSFVNQQQSGFELPPSAIGSRNNSTSPPKAGDHGNASVSPTSPRVEMDTSRKRSHAETSLPPPPSRSRKIIQVKPKEQQLAKRQSVDDADYEPGSKAAPGSKKKGATTSAGRKIARKTAHSLIERRRRSKMNEEFGVLKDLIPACRGHEMHKLAILQASIDYLRYLEDCIADLKSDGRDLRSAYSPQQRMDAQDHASPGASSDDEDEDEDEEMPDSTEHNAPAPAPRVDTRTGSAASLHAPAPAQSEVPNAFTNYREQRHYSMVSSEAPSPFLGAQNGGSRDWYGARPQSQSSYPASPTVHSSRTSPMILPQAQSSDIDREASAALLMLNASDRRTSMSQPAKVLAEVRQGNMKAISVKDLLSN